MRKAKTSQDDATRIEITSNLSLFADGTIRRTDEPDLIRKTTHDTVGSLIDNGDKFVFMPTTQLSERECKQVEKLVEMFNDRGIGSFWQEREAQIAARLPYLDEQTKDAHAILKSLDANYLTEEDVRRSVCMYSPEFAAAFVDLWKTGKIVPQGRNEYGEILWAAAPTDAEQ